MSGKLTLVPYSDIHKSVWDTVVDASINGTFIHKRDFIGYHGVRFNEASLIFFLDSLAVAVFPAETYAHRVFSHRGLTYGGWVITKNLAQKHLAEIVGGTFRYFGSLGYQSLEVRMVPSFLCMESQEGLLGLISAHLPRVTQMRMYYATPLPFEIKDRGRKWGKRKALSNGVSIRESNDFSRFWAEVLKPHLMEKFGNHPVHSSEEICGLRADFQENIKLLVAYKGDQMIAGAVLFLTNLAVHTQYIASTRLGREKRALDLLFATIIENYGAEMRFLSLGTSLDAKSGAPIEGLINWKRSLGAYEIAVPDFEFIIG